MKISNEPREIAVVSSLILLTCLIFSFALFGVAGIRVALGIAFVSAPFYLMLRNFSLDEGEKFVFSILLGLTIFPSLAYLLGFIMAFRWSIAISFILLMAASLMTRMKKKETYGKV